jgi:hypothetical protein
MRQLTPDEQARYSQMLVGLSQDPAYRGIIAPLIAKKYPEHAGSFSDVALTNRMVDFEKRMARKETEAELKKFNERAESQRRDLVKSGRYTDDQTKEIRAVMDRYGLYDYNAGAVLYSHEREPETPHIPLPHEAPTATWEFPSVEGRDGKTIPFADFVKDPNGASLNAAYRVIGDFRQKRLPIALQR